MVFPKSLLFSLLSPNFYYAMTKKTLWWSESRDSHSTPRLTPPWTSDFSSIKWKDWKQDRKDSDQQKYSVIPLANLNPAPFYGCRVGQKSVTPPTVVFCSDWSLVQLCSLSLITLISPSKVLTLCLEQRVVSTGEAGKGDLRRLSRRLESIFLTPDHLYNSHLN